MSELASHLDEQEGTPSSRGAGQATAPEEGSRATEFVSRGTALAFSAQSLFSAAMALVILVYMSKFYVDAVLVPAGVLAVVIAGSRAFDALTDPVVGYLTDHTRTRWGRRKPWIFAGVVGNAVTYYLLFSPPRSLSGSDAVAWYAPVLVLNFAFYAMSFVPRQALGVELTLDASQRHRLYGFSAAFIAAGTMLGAILPVVLQAKGIREPREQMRVHAAILATGYLLMNLVLLYIIRERPGFMGRGEVPFVPGVRRALRNRPFRIMFLSHVITAIPLVIPAMLMPFFVQWVLRLEVIKWTGLLTLTYLASGFVCVPLWVAMARRRGKLAVWKVASLVAVTGGAALFFVGPGQGGRAFLIELYVGSQSAAWFFLFGSMHADVIDYDELHTGKRREAQFSSILSIVPKFALIPGAALPLAALGAVGYTPSSAHQPEAVVPTLRVLFAVVPPVVNLVGLSIMWWYPLTESKHAAVRDAIVRHGRGEAAVDPLTGREILPPRNRDVDEETSWFLDYFSKRELRGLLRRPQSAVLSAAGLFASFAVLTALGATYAWLHLGTPDRDPGPLPALAIVGAGMCLATAIFHGLRLPAAVRLARRPPERDVIARHLAAIE
ncbi:MAG TPA: MFS transporter [Polyangiaceae bacterium]|nr:MFS transporter [Polyangiaceae bacterium]